jgi:predicted P-loop ATPase/GTPase
MADTITLNNVGSSAWEATSVNGTNISADTTVENPVINLSNIGTRYIFYNDGYSAHPLEFLDSNGDILLSQSGTGTFESDGSVNWVDNDTSVEFTLTTELSDQITQYRCTIHTAAMAGSISSPQTVDYTPSTGSVSITSPSNNATLTNPVSVSMQATDFIIESASNGVQDGAGHFHLLVDQPAVTAGEVIPNNPDNGYYHYGDGSTSAELDLSVGTHTIRLQAGDANHRAYNLTDSVDVTVEVDYTPATGSVSFTTPSDGSTVLNPVLFEMQATDFLIEAASNGVQDGAGHFHLLVDQPAVTAGEVIPNNPDNGYYHYGDGSTSAELDLSVGTHTIRLQAGDANHRAYNLTDSVDVTVEVDYTPATGSVSFTTPSDGSTVLNPVLFEMQATDFLIEAASNGVQDGAGHFHILVDQPAVTAGNVIPNNPDNGYYHYGDGSTSTEIDLTTGSHTVRLQVGDANHKAYDLTDSVTITVDAQSSSGTTTDTVNPISVTKDVGHINTIETTVELENRGATQTTNTVELVTGTTTVDSQSVTLAVGDTTTVTLSDSTFGQTEIGSTRRYEVVTGGREPLIDANIIGVLKIAAGTQEEVPSFDVSEVRIEQTGELHFDQTDTLNLSQ